MKTTHRITIDLIRKDVAPVAHAMQNDANSRVVEITLLENGSAWVPPAGTTFALSYGKPDGTKGFYSTLPDGSDAISSDGNIVSVTLAPQVLTVAGVANAALVMSDPDANRISAFPLEIHVTADPSAGATDSEDYFDPSFGSGNFLPMPAAANVGQYFRVKAVDESGKVTEVEAVDLNAETPTAYLYNGVKLPPLPEWDKEEYPYVYIAHRVFTTYELYIAYNTKEKLFIDSSGTGDTDGINNTQFKCNVCQASSSDNYVWDAWEDYAGGAYPPIWSNYDVMSLVDGSVYLAASEPVPAYSGADSTPVIIDLDTYGGETSLAFTLVSLLLNGGGEQEDVELGDLFADLSTDRPIRIKIPILSSATSIFVDGVSTVRTDGQAEQLGFHIVINNNGALVSAIVFVTANGVVTARVSQM